jgi:hypothetical protein
VYAVAENNRCLRATRFDDERGSVGPDLAKALTTFQGRPFTFKTTRGCIPSPSGHEFRLLGESTPAKLGGEGEVSGFGQSQWCRLTQAIRS